MKSVALPEVEYIAFRLAKELMTYNEPIPDFGSRFPHALESCLSTPFQSFGGKQLYEGLLGKGAALFYLLIKNHPFENGNKRIAMTTLFYFLYKNGKWLRVDNQELYNFAKWVAASNAKVKGPTLLAVQKFVKVHLVTLSS